MPIQDVRFQPRTVSIAGTDVRIWTFRDSTGDRVSINEDTLVYARNASPTGTEFLRTINGVTPNSTFGPVVPYNCKIVWLTASAANTPNVPLKIWSGGATLSTLTWNSQNQAWALDVDVSQMANISIEHAYDPMDLTQVQAQYPIVVIGYRWRF